jgi:hypothetical protein
VGTVQVHPPQVRRGPNALWSRRVFLSGGQDELGGLDAKG